MKAVCAFEIILYFICLIIVATNLNLNIFQLSQGHNPYRLIKIATNTTQLKIMNIHVLAQISQTLLNR